ncbi:hypothetical protein EMCRGX_G027643 [Ephydatia muelleri]
MMATLCRHIANTHFKHTKGINICVAQEVYYSLKRRTAGSRDLTNCDHEVTGDQLLHLEPYLYASSRMESNM